MHTSERETMKKLFYSALMIFAVVLTACSSQSSGTAISSTNNDLPIETQLAVGTLKLDGTAQDVSVGQAEQLLLYWPVYKVLSQSETAAQAEIDGLISQIQETMTDDQMQAIRDLDITQQDVFASTEGVVASSGASASSVSLPASSSDGGNMPAGGPPAAGSAPPDGGMPADMGGAASASSTDQSQGTQAGSGSAGTTGLPIALVEAVIQSLQQKIAA
jgi:hypothetical protein